MLLSIALLPAVAASGETQSDPRNAHGIFTGEIKAVIYVTDVEKGAPYYRDVFGFAFDGFANLDGEPYYAEMVAGEVKFALHEPTSPGQEAKIGQQRLYFRVRNLDDQYMRVAAWAGDPGEIKRRDWMDMFIVRDPDGNEIVFAVTDPERHGINPWNTEEPAER
jgi:predicted enzyme related to lactoylglutathione lyase